MKQTSSGPITETGSQNQMHVRITPRSKTTTCSRTTMRSQPRISQRSYTQEDEDEETCICENIKIRVFYINIRSINPENKTPAMKFKIERLRGRIQRYKPQLIVFVETWLTKNHRSSDVMERLDLDGYRIIGRYDRGDGHHEQNSYCLTTTGEEDRRGGGILVLWKQGCNSVKCRKAPSENYADNVVNFDLYYAANCYKCLNGKQWIQKFGLTIVYRRPGPFRNQSKLFHLFIAIDLVKSVKII